MWQAREIPMKMGFLFCESAMKEKIREQGQPIMKKILFKRLPRNQASVRKQTKHVISLLFTKSIFSRKNREKGREGIVIEVVEQSHNR